MLADARGRFDLLECHTRQAGSGWIRTQRCAPPSSSAPGLPATSATLATVELLRRARVRQFGLVSPYTSDVQDRIIAKYAALGFECAAERHGALVDNFAVAGISQDILVEMIREVAAAGPQAISVLCTQPGRRQPDCTAGR